MPDVVAHLPWTEEQWATVQRIVHEAASKARVASSFLPLVGPLPPGQASVPKLQLAEAALGTLQRGEVATRLEVDDGETLKLTTIDCEVYLTTVQAEDPTLASAKQMLGRAADVIGRLEDTVVFRGQPLPAGLTLPAVYSVIGGQTNRGLLDGSFPSKTVSRTTGVVDSDSLVTQVVAAINLIESKGHYGPFPCILGHELYEAANRPSPNSLVLPSDRIVPFLDGGPLRRSSVVPSNEGIVLGLAGSPIDLVVASDVHVKFLQLSVEPRYILRVSERFVLRIKQDGAICRLTS